MTGPKSLLSAPPHEVSGFAALSGFSTVSNTIVARCTVTCGRRQFGIAPNPLGVDASHSLSTSGITLDSCANAVGFPSSYPMVHGNEAHTGANLSLAACPLDGCDGDNHRLINDVDGTLSSTGVASSYISK
jgi:hypothetical protein